MLLCIEMAVFSIFHLWAFPWQVYDIRRSQIVAAESAPGFLPDPKTAYKGGPLGSRALVDAFNPWDLIKNIGRGFKWFVVGRRNRMDDISYKNSARGTGLEPTRYQNTAADNGGNGSIDGGPQPYMGGGKQSRYQPIGDDEDVDHLLTHAQSNPRDPSPNPPYPRPMERLPNRNPAAGGGDISQMGTYDPPPLKAAGALQHRNLPYPSGGHESGTLDPSSQSLSTQDTSYHGAGAGHRRTLTPITIPPDTHPLGPPGRKSHEAEEWDMFGGVTGAERGSERDLGGGHGVGDNRF